MSLGRFLPNTAFGILVFFFSWFWNFCHLSYLSFGVCIVPVQNLLRHLQLWMQGLQVSSFGSSK